MTGHGGGLIRNKAPTGGNGGLSDVGGVGAGDGGQGDLVDGGREGCGWGLDQGDVVADGQRDVVGVLDPVGAGDSVGELRAGTNGSSVVDDHGGGAAGAVGGRQNPGVADDGTTAPPAARRRGEAESHLVGELVDHGVVSVGDATLNGRNCGPVTRMHISDLGQEPSGGGGDGQEQDCEDLHADGWSNTE